MLAKRWDSTEAIMRTLGFVTEFAIRTFMSPHNCKISSSPATSSLASSSATVSLVFIAPRNATSHSLCGGHVGGTVAPSVGCLPSRLVGVFGRGQDSGHPMAMHGLVFRSLGFVYSTHCRNERAAQWYESSCICYHCFYFVGVSCRLCRLCFKCVKF